MLSGVRLQQKVAPIAQKLRGMSSIPRLSILYILQSEPTPLPDLIARTKMSPSLVAHHVRILEKTGWVTRTKYGKSVTYFIHEKMTSQVKALFM